MEDSIPQTVIAPKTRRVPGWMKRPIFFIVLLGLLLRLGSMAINYDEMRWQNDQRITIPAVRILEGKGFSLQDGAGATAYRPPLYVLWIAGAYGVFGTFSLLGPSFLQVLVSAGSVYLIYLLALQIWKREEYANASALILAIHPYVVYHDAALYHTFLSTALLLGGFFLLFRGIEKLRKRELFFSGICFGLCILIISVIVPFLGLLVIAGIALWKITWKRRMVLVAMFLAGLLVAWGPWIIRNAVVFHAFIPLTTESGSTLWIGNNPEAEVRLPLRTHESSPVPQGTRFNIPEQYGYCNEQPDVCEGGVSEAEESRELKNLAMEWIKAHPNTFVRLTIWRYASIWSPFLTPAKTFFGSQLLTAVITYGYFSWNIALYALILFGTWTAWHANKKRETILLWLLALSGTGAYALFLYFTKYRIPFESILIVLAGPGLIMLRDRLRLKLSPPQLEGHE